MDATITIMGLNPKLLDFSYATFQSNSTLKEILLEACESVERHALLVKQRFSFVTNSGTIMTNVSH